MNIPRQRRYPYRPIEQPRPAPKIYLDPPNAITVIHSHPFTWTGGVTWTQPVTFDTRKD